MTIVGRSEVIDCSNPKLDIFLRLAGDLVDVASLEYTIKDPSDVQTFPPSGREAVDLTDCPTGDRIGTGHYVARWTVPVDQVIGTHTLDWFWLLTGGSPEGTFAEEFEVLSVSPSAGDGYCSVAEIRAEGVPASVIDDVALQTKIDLASRTIDRVTGNVFSPMAATFQLDGRGDRRLTLSMPIISITEVSIVDAAGGTTVVDSTLYEVYNRHLSQNLRNPDDRFDPRIQYIGNTGRGVVNDIYIRSPRGRIWPRGQKNVQIEGFFGFTDWDAGNSRGVTPLEIARACALLTMKDLPLLAEEEDRWESQMRSRITDVKTRDQSIRLGSGAAGAGRAAGAYGYLSGDEEVDRILEHFMAPLAIGHT